MIKKYLDNIIMFFLGGAIYVLLEIVFRGYSFRLMAFLGGLIFLFGGMLNNKFSWKMDLLLQCAVISALTTIGEILIGTLDYYYLHLNMWDYSNMPFNSFNAKICLPFSVLWFFIGFIVVFVSDAITYYWMHDGACPEYYILGKKRFCMPVRNCIKH